MTVDINKWLLSMHNVCCDCSVYKMITASTRIVYSAENPFSASEDTGVSCLRYCTSLFNVHSVFFRRIHRSIYEEISWATTYFCWSMTNWDLRSSKKGPRQTLFKHFYSYFLNIGLVEPEFDGSKLLRKCWSP